MENRKKEIILNRIFSGCIRCRIDDSTFIYKSPTRIIKCMADEKYIEALKESSLYEVLDEKELLSFLYENDLWSLKEQEEIDIIPKDIEELKFKLFSSFLRSNTRKVIRTELNVKKNRLVELLSKRHSYDHISCEGYASLTRLKYIICNSIFDENDNKIIINDDRIVEKVLNEINSHKLSEEQFRELARTDPWRQYWILNKANVFGVCPIDLTDDQKNLCVWSKIYDNVYESNEAPDEEVIMDDDMLDGWFISQRRKKEAEIGKKEVNEVLTNSKIRNSQDIFIVAENEEDAKKVESMNNSYAKMIKRQRDVAMKSGEVKEADMPDVKQDLMMQIAKMNSK